MKRIALALLLLLIAPAPFAQALDSAEWWNYEGSRDGHPYAVRLDMGLRRIFPVSGFPYVVVTGVAYPSGRADGLPDLDDQNRLDGISEALAAAIARKTRSIYAGTAAGGREQRNYIYVSDPNGLEELIAGIYARLCRGCKTSTQIRADAAWTVYRDFLFPDEETRRRYGLRAY
ncbi:MAG: hypothetical protein GAK35_03593 [Herbaspirillum frisingense]|uniref:DUF695 domain-containing protein n=1 Tax=Herbaspirillum frisingense TaxID=92645 RepID=A0A7V8JSQ9_9BURK|nr:MAG: hypothetical protein GAK35_03593 [Herbaspirillum frisingense]